MLFRMLSLVILLSCATARAAIYPEFNQAVMINSDLPNGMVGFCSGVAIDNRTVLTAAHCLESGTQHRIQVKGRFFNIKRWIYANAPTVISADYHKETSMSDSDIGILQFSEKIPFKPLQICRELHAQDSLYEVGFGGRNGKNEFTLFRVNGSEIQLGKGSIQVTLDDVSVSGDSGAPVFAIENGNACLYAIHSSIGLEETPRKSFNPIIRKTLLPFTFN